MIITITITIKIRTTENHMNTISNSPNLHISSPSHITTATTYQHVYNNYIKQNNQSPNALINYLLFNQDIIHISKKAHKGVSILLI